MNEALEQYFRTILRQVREQFPDATNLSLSLTLPEEAFNRLADAYAENVTGEFGYLTFDIGAYPSLLRVMISRKRSVKVTSRDQYIQHMRRKLVQEALDDALMEWEDKVNRRAQRQVQIRKLEEKPIPDRDVVLSLMAEGSPDINPLYEGLFENGDEIAQEVADLVWQAVKG